MLVFERGCVVGTCRVLLMLVRRTAVCTSCGVYSGSCGKGGARLQMYRDCLVCVNILLPSPVADEDTGGSPAG